jgi:serine/threonine protein kinase
MPLKLKDAFWQEISIMWKFRDHAMFCKVYGYSKDPASMIMKYYPMGDLSHFIARKNDKFPYSKLLVVSLILQYCKGIEIMHNASIVHNDIKPANCLLEDHMGELKLIIADFGITTIVSESALHVKAFNVSSLKGASIQYAAPEVLKRNRGGPGVHSIALLKAGDSYSLAATMLAMMQRRGAWF